MPGKFRVCSSNMESTCDAVLLTQDQSEVLQEITNIIMGRVGESVAKICSTSWRCFPFCAFSPYRRAAPSACRIAIASTVRLSEIFSIHPEHGRMDIYIQCFSGVDSPRSA